MEQTKVMIMRETPEIIKLRVKPRRSIREPITGVRTPPPSMLAK
jgi:hypothetical protein